MAAGKDSKGKNLIKKRFPKLGRVNKISSAGGGVPTFTLTPSSGWLDVTEVSGVQYTTTNSVQITSSLPFTIGVEVNDFSSLTDAPNSSLEISVTNTSGFGTVTYSIPDWPAAPVISPITSGQYVTFRINNPQPAYGAVRDLAIYKIISGASTLIETVTISNYR